MARLGTRGIRSRRSMRHLTLMSLLLAAILVPRARAAAGADHAAGLAPCNAAQPAQPLPPTGVATIEHAYTCLLAQLDGPATVRLRIHRPVDGRTLAVALAPAPYPAAQAVTARVLPGDVAYVRLSSFVDNAANFVIAALDGLGLGAPAWFGARSARQWERSSR